MLGSKKAHIISLIQNYEKESDGNNKKLKYRSLYLLTIERYSRHAKDLLLPREILINFPSLVVDGELWFGRDAFNNGKVYSNETSWNSFLIVAFDCPELSSQILPFEDRFSLLFPKISRKHPFLLLCAMVKCVDANHILFTIMPFSSSLFLLQFILSSLSPNFVIPRSSLFLSMNWTCLLLMQLKYEVVFASDPPWKRRGHRVERSSLSL